jgi:Uma2 family endonuclease
MDTTEKRGDHPDMRKSTGDMEATVKTHAITVAEFDRMVAAGVYGREDRIELIDGQLIDVPPQGPPHFGTLTRFEHRFRAFGTRALVRGQGPLPVGTDSQPEPDIAIVRWNDRLYGDAHPTVEETYAVVEIAYTSQKFDRGVKRRIYGAGRIPEYWIVDLEAQAIEVYREPHDLGYASPAIYRRGQSVSFAAFPDVVFSVDELLG